MSEDDEVLDGIFSSGDTNDMVEKLFIQVKKFVEDESLHEMTIREDQFHYWLEDKPLRKSSDVDILRHRLYDILKQLGVHRTQGGNFVEGGYVKCKSGNSKENGKDIVWIRKIKRMGKK
jgi:hypothetical protein